ncbi:MAG: hypothetical protein EAZ49_25125 [Oscillatoriales cyanobacterium]|nr:MAG: hypothetical protein EAZ49_25125 [Oscillatoriales cyanobacterium]
MKKFGNGFCSGFNGCKRASHSTSNPNPQSPIQNPQFKIANPQSKIQNPQSKIQNLKSKIE